MERVARWKEQDRHDLFVEAPSLDRIMEVLKDLEDEINALGSREHRT